MMAAVALLIPLGVMRGLCTQLTLETTVSGEAL